MLEVSYFVIGKDRADLAATSAVSTESLKTRHRVGEHATNAGNGTHDSVRLSSTDAGTVG